MKATNAVSIRRSLGTVLAQLEGGGEPIVVEKAGRAVAVLVSIEAFRERFGNRTATDEREALHAEILAERPAPSRRARGSVEEIRRLRGHLR